MNQGPLDLQSNALPLSYTPDEKYGERDIETESKRERRKEIVIERVQ